MSFFFSLSIIIHGPFIKNNMTCFVLAEKAQTKATKGQELKLLLSLDVNLVRRTNSFTSHLYVKQMREETRANATSQKGKCKRYNH